ncbi:MAG: T9SS type A sorting domain-containing protein [Bacteroidota bacterium]
MNLLHSCTLTLLFLFSCISVTYAQPTPAYSCGGAATDMYLVILTNPNATDADDGTVDGNCDYVFELDASNSPFGLISFNYVGTGTATPPSTDVSNSTNGFITVTSPCGSVNIQFDITTQLGAAICQIRNAFMPVELVHFEATAIKEGILLNWSTATEINNLGFDIERSTNGKIWKKVDFVQGNLTTLSSQTYEFTDKNPLDGKSYYRLKQIDIDGQFEYSEIIVTDYTQLGFVDIKVLPNPAKEEILLFIGEQSRYEMINVSIFDNFGRLVKQEILSENRLMVDDLPYGIYHLMVNFNNQIRTTRLLKQ